MPAIRKMPRIACITRTWRALSPSGGLNALTALETASMPVSEEPPLAYAFSSMKMIAKVSRPWVLWPYATAPPETS